MEYLNRNTKKASDFIKRYNRAEKGDISRTKSHLFIRYAPIPTY